MLALFAIGTVLFAALSGYSWADAIYLTVLDAAGAAQPDAKFSVVDKIIQVMITLVGISLIPLAAPAFAAAMMQRQVLATIPVGRTVLVLAEVPVRAGCELAGLAASAMHLPRQARLIALHGHTSDDLDLPPRAERLLATGDRLYVVATPAGLATTIARSIPATKSSSTPDGETRRLTDR